MLALATITSSSTSLKKFHGDVYQGGFFQIILHIMTALRLITAVPF